MEKFILLCCTFCLTTHGELLGEPLEKEVFLRYERNESIFSENDGSETLQLVSVIFRHGNRTVAGPPKEMYPNDPYRNYSYFPVGLGQLTSAGKVRAYSVGVALRKRYNEFLGRYYYPGIAEALSSDVDRTKMSLQLVLAALFPPTKEDMAVTGLNWQPIPYNYIPAENDKIFHGFHCPKFLELYKKYTAQPSVQKKFRSHQQTLDYVSKHTGFNMKTIQGMYYLYFVLSTQEENGLTLPEWTKSVWPETITKLAVEEYHIAMGYPDMRKLSIGYFLQKLLDDINRRIRDNKRLFTKIRLHSGHERVMAKLLLGLEVFDEQIPPCSSYIIWELHKIDNIYGIKMFYERWDGKGLRPLKLPHCEEFCPLDEFKRLISDLLPSPGSC